MTADVVTAASEYSINLVLQEGKTTLKYEEGPNCLDFRLHDYGRGSDHAVVDYHFLFWTKPLSQIDSTHRELIKSRILTWCREKGIRIEIDSFLYNGKCLEVWRYIPPRKQWLSEILAEPGLAPVLGLVIGAQLGNWIVGGGPMNLSMSRHAMLAASIGALLGAGTGLIVWSCAHLRRRSLHRQSSPIDTSQNREVLAPSVEARPLNYSVDLHEDQDGKHCKLIYVEGKHRLEVDLTQEQELRTSTIVLPFWFGSGKDLDTWTDPAGVAIDRVHRKLIRKRLLVDIPYRFPIWFSETRADRAEGDLHGWRILATSMAICGGAGFVIGLNARHLKHLLLAVGLGLLMGLVAGLIAWLWASQQDHGLNEGS